MKPRLGQTGHVSAERDGYYKRQTGHVSAERDGYYKRQTATIRLL